MNSNIQEVIFTECKYIHQINSSYQCAFAKHTNDCLIEDGIFEYTLNLYCKLPPNLFPLALTILFIWLIFLFVSLGVAADNFFCPSLVVIARVMRMSDNIAGITLLAFGNGAPDVFSAISAVKNMKHGDEGLVFGALLGAGIFLTTVVVGAIAFIKPFKSMERPFLRDIIYYIVVTFFVFYICFTGIITLLQSIVFIVGYLVYVIIIVLSRILHQYIKRNSYSIYDSGNAPIDDCSIVREYENTDTQTADPFLPTLLTVSTESTPLIAQERSVDLYLQIKYFFTSISPIEPNEWKENGIIYRSIAVFKAPALLALKLTVPVVNYVVPLNNWNKHLSVVQCFVTPVFSVFAANREFAKSLINGVMPVWCLFLIGGSIAAIIVICTSKSSVAPVYHPVFAFVGFFAAVLWIKTIADEIVNILQTFGIVFNISSAILGLTFLAWGNSIGDFISNLSMTQRGFPKAGFSACFGGPLFNTLLGIGIPFTRAAFSNSPNYSIPIQFTEMQLLLFIFLGISLLSSLVLLPLSDFKVGKLYGAYLIVLYIIFLLLSILVETQTIHFPNI